MGQKNRKSSASRKKQESRGGRYGMNCLKKSTDGPAIHRKTGRLREIDRRKFWKGSKAPCNRVLQCLKISPGPYKHFIILRRVIANARKKGMQARLADSGKLRQAILHGEKPLIIKFGTAFVGTHPDF